MRSTMMTRLTMRQGELLLRLMDDLLNVSEDPTVRVDAWRLVRKLEEGLGYERRPKMKPPKKINRTKPGWCLR